MISFKNRAVAGNTDEQYTSTYGIKEIDNGIQLNFVTKTKYGKNFGSRVYFLDGPNKYQMFKLKNREFTMTADMFFMPCGLNGAVYFVEMDADGGQARAAASGGSNNAGAKYGTGYCDAQCPHDIKFMEGPCKPNSSRASPCVFSKAWTVLFNLEPTPQNFVAKQCRPCRV